MNKIKLIFVILIFTFYSSIKSMSVAIGLGLIVFNKQIANFLGGKLDKYIANKKRSPQDNLTFGVASNDLDLIEETLKQGVNVNLNDNYICVRGKTLLMLAVSEGYIQVAERLITAGADINAKDGNGWRALDYAVLRNNVGVAWLLIYSGAYISKRASNYCRSKEMEEFLEQIRKVKINRHEENIKTKVIQSTKINYDICKIIAEYATESQGSKEYLELVEQEDNWLSVSSS